MTIICNWRSHWGYRTQRPTKYQSSPINKCHYLVYPGRSQWPPSRGVEEIQGRRILWKQILTDNFIVILKTAASEYAFREGTQKLSQVRNSVTSWCDLTIKVRAWWKLDGLGIHQQVVNEVRVPLSSVKPRGGEMISRGAMSLRAPRGYGPVCT